MGIQATANFLSGMLKAIPPMNELFRQAGMELLPMLGSDLPDALTQKEAHSESVETEPGAVEA